ncbi:sigma factor-binding protein Crl [Moellerella wisconsensis]|uniref:Sigma factor-binding protein Crl n=3 Tax=Moellerella wisconsensis TaxID=158849 RepID=A0A9Q8Q4C2_9GAMM|nr:sigma factor-binding protein Crl [Moellerella wisconsensis]KLN97859.1 hypothetical protein VK86_02440 [Moellerella wisconsensis]UNH24818.1 sigma factor-binding protein Crl [Moellerella wisconsensis]UNH27933.1 sigma factor-binding protein Crl [Moellerella wisconsensis]UNH31438.1 sigma factor-binding protein Crl [Moellerella wisconsensis]UNH39545.1 sigma factor-binding protein Crl [Moellerella wisconsensis]
MALPFDYSNGKYLKKFTDLGPYLRALKCQNDQYFFDSLVVCINTKIEPETREFWGWWLDLEKTDSEFFYRYQLGRYDNQGHWQVEPLDNHEVLSPIEQNIQDFHQRLCTVFDTLELKLLPSPQMTKFRLKLIA